jgi:hypothetical protein
MGVQRVGWPRARWVLAGAAGAAIVLGSVGWAGGAAGASGHSPAGQFEGATARGARHPEHGPKLPFVGNATNLSREPVIHAMKGKPPTKLEVKNLVVGTGATVKATSTVKVLYVGANYKTGKVFTQVTWIDKRPTAFPLSGVVRGFAEGLVGMKVGGRREIVIPPKLGYGNTSSGPIKPDETLVFVVDLKGVSG